MVKELLNGVKKLEGVVISSGEVKAECLKGRLRENPEYWQSYSHCFLVKVCLFWQVKQVFKTWWVSLLVSSQFSSPFWNSFWQWLHLLFVWFVFCQLFFSKEYLFWHKTQKFIVVIPSFWRFQYSWPLLNDFWHSAHLSNGGVHWFDI